MGLDITAYGNISKVDCVFDADGDPIDPVTRQPIEGQWFKAYQNPDFADRARDVEHNSIYTYQRDIHVHAGSYSGYNTWREKLAQMAGYQPVPVVRYTVEEMRHDAGAHAAGSGPFYELIWFSDCEGTIGTEVCAKLAKDFSEFHVKAAAFNGGMWWLDKYNEWRAAFELAAQSGCICFR